MLDLIIVFAEVSKVKSGEGVRAPSPYARVPCSYCHGSAQHEPQVEGSGHRRSLRAVLCKFYMIYTQNIHRVRISV